MSADPDRAVAARAASLLLRYPDDEVMAALPAVLAALDELPDGIGGRLRLVADHRAATGATRLATEYVELFDFRRRCCLYLTFYTCGDTRRRGEALAGFAAVFRAAGLRVVDGELPDYLPAVLDLAASTSADGSGWQLLRDHRIGLDLLSTALAKQGSVYRNAVDAVRELLPAARPSDLAAAARLARTGPPAEQVGLEPFALDRSVHSDPVGGRR